MFISMIIKSVIHRNKTILATRKLDSLFVRQSEYNFMKEFQCITEEITTIKNFFSRKYQ